MYLYYKWQLNISTFSIWRLSKIYQSGDFWFENIPSGNPEKRPAFIGCKLDVSFACEKMRNSVFFRRAKNAKVNSQDCQIIPGSNIPKREHIYQMTTNYTKWH
jgi:hypothetical protein